MIEDDVQKALFFYLYNILWFKLDFTILIRQIDRIRHGHII